MLSFYLTQASSNECKHGIRFEYAYYEKNRQENCR